MAKEKEEAMSPQQEKLKALQAAMSKIEKDFGKGSIMRMGDEQIENVEVIPTGSIGLNAALGVGGYPKGRIIEIYGPESSGKTTFALQAIAEHQKKGGRAAFIDAEHALDPVYAEKLGVNIDELLLSQPDTGEQALEICDALVSSGAISIVVIDSVAALVPQAEIDGEMGDSHVGLQARLMSQALRKLSGTINKTNTTAPIIIRSLYLPQKPFSFAGDISFLEGDSTAPKTEVISRIVSSVFFSDSILKEILHISSVFGHLLFIDSLSIVIFLFSFIS